MEAPALFTVAQVFGIQAASVFWLSDVLHGQQWEPHLHSADVSQTLWKLFEAVDTCLTAPPAAIPGPSAAPGIAPPETH